MLPEILTQPDISTSSSDFQPASVTASPGATGRVADAGHVHPEPETALGYQIITGTVVTPPNDGGQTESSGIFPVSFTLNVPAPTGYSVVSGSVQGAAGVWSGLISSYADSNGRAWSVNVSLSQSYPAADGRSWNFSGSYTPVIDAGDSGYETYGTLPIGVTAVTASVICIGISSS